MVDEQRESVAYLEGRFDVTERVMKVCDEEWDSYKGKKETIIRLRELCEHIEQPKVDTDEVMDRVAFRMFARNMEDYEFVNAEVHLAWATDPDLQKFWTEQAQAVLDDFKVERMEVAEASPDADAVHERGSN